MATQDVGSAFLAGFSAIQGMNQQRRDNEFRNRQQDEIERSNLANEDINTRKVKVQESTEARFQDEQDRKFAVEDANSSVEKFNAANLLNPTMTGLNIEQFNQNIANGDAATLQLGLEQINKSGLLGEGLTATGLVPAPDGSGRFAVTVQNPDGSEGVVTEDRSSGPDSNVVFFDTQKITNLVDLAYRDIASIASSVDATRTKMTTNIVDADMKSQKDEEDFVRQIEANNQLSGILDTIRATGDPRAISGAADLLASGASFEDFENLLSNIQQDIDPEGDVVGEQIEIRTNIAGVKSGDRVTFEEGGLRAGEESDILGSQSLAQRLGLEGQYGETGRANADSSGLSFDQQLINPNGEGSFNTRLKEVDAEIEALGEQFKNQELSPKEFDAQKSKLDARRKSIVKGANNQSVRKIRKLEERRDALIDRGMMDQAQDLQNEIDNEFGSKYTTAGLVKFGKQIKGKSAAQIDKLAESDQLKLDSAALEQAAKNFKNAGIEKYEDIARANKKTQLEMRAVLLANAADANEREAIRTSMNNLTETGDLTMSSDDVADNRRADRQLQLDRDEYELDLDQYRTGRFDTISEETSAYNQLSSNLFTNDDGELDAGMDEVNRAANELLPDMLFKAKNAPNVNDARLYYKAASGTISNMLAVLADEDEGGFVETFKDLFGRKEASESWLSSDFDLSRVRPQYENGKVVAYFYMDAQGSPTSERILADDLADVNSSIEEIVREAAIFNEKNK